MTSILTATLRDLGPLREVERACFPQDAWPLLDLIAVLTFPDVVRLKAVEDGRMVAFAAGYRQAEHGLGWIATIGVLPDYRRRGLGRALLDATEAGLALSRIRLCVRTGNADAIRLYEASGYRKVDVWERYYDDGGEALVMEKHRPAEGL